MADEFGCCSQYKECFTAGECVSKLWTKEDKCSWRRYIEAVEDLTPKTKGRLTKTPNGILVCIVVCIASRKHDMVTIQGVDTAGNVHNYGCKRESVKFFKAT